ncbi:hypothetical protein [Gemmata sp.]|uniref:hypothetical protein n=1 Tax=Gemmata sp. TaxID=1914242 RepID=UPI003F70F744
MLDTLTSSAAEVLFSNQPATGFQLWYRPGRGNPWEVVATASTHTECVAEIGTGGRHNGHWIALPLGQEP